MQDVYLEAIKILVSTYPKEQRAKFIKGAERSFHPEIRTLARELQTEEE